MCDALIATIELYCHCVKSKTTNFDNEERFLTPGVASNLKPQRDIPNMRVAAYSEMGFYRPSEVAREAVPMK